MLRTSLTLFCLALTLTGCICRPPRYNECHPSQIEANRNDYARRAYREQQELARLDLSPPYQEEITEEDLVLALEEADLTWERYPYETVEEWVDRLQSILRVNRDALLLLMEQYETLENQERGLARSIQELSRQNESLRKELSDRDPSSSETMGSLAMSSSAQQEYAPFTLHLVQRGETLYSIARHYYNNPEMVSSILLWNQGWIRHPEELVAGLSLVLFPEGYELQDTQVVDRYLRELEVSP